MSSPVSSRRILLVDDDPMLLTVHKMFLTRSGFEVLEASGLEEAMVLLTQQGPASIDTVISDYRMPGGSGIELLQRIKKLDPTLSVVIATAQSDMGSISKILAQGAAAYLEKPVDPKRLLTETARAVLRTLREREPKQP